MVCIVWMCSVHGTGSGQASSREAPYINHIELVSRFVALLAAVCCLPRRSASFANLIKHARTHKYTRAHTRAIHTRTHCVITS